MPRPSKNTVDTKRLDAAIEALTHLYDAVRAIHPSALPPYAVNKFTAALDKTGAALTELQHGEN